MKKVLYVLAIITILFSCDTNYDDPEFDAIYNVQDYVIRNIPTPSTAEFTNTTATELSKDVYLVKGSVDFENIFGSMIRRQFSCEIEFKPNDKYIINEFKLY